jgi:hypothetical protein
MKLDIAFDLDGCFVDIMSQLKERLKEIDTLIMDNGRFEIETLPPLTVDELWGHFRECYCDWQRIPIYPGARDLCDILWAMSGCPIHFITNRPSESATFTHLMVERFCKVPYTISFVDKIMPKYIYLNGINNFVEDRRATAREIAGTGRTVYVPQRPWNEMEDTPGIVKIEGIHSLMFIAEEFIFS